MPEIEAPKHKLIPIYIMGQKHMVPDDSTIIGALEYVGYQLKRGVGCREGFCGACATVYRVEGDYKLYGGLACQTVVVPNMYIVQIPFAPAEKAVYNIDELKPDVSVFQRYYPELFRCVACNSCTKICPQEIQVMDYIQALIRGDIALAADLSFDCIMCGLCAMRCPAEMAQYNIAILARRLYGKYLAPKAEFFRTRLKEVEDGKFDEEIAHLMKMSREELDKAYYSRKIDFKVT